MQYIFTRDGLVANWNLLDSIYFYSDENKDKIRHSIATNYKFQNNESYTIRLLVNKKCNMACSYCNMRTAMNNSKIEVMPIELAKKALNTAKQFIDANTKVTVNLSGGEPMLINESLVEYVLLAKKEFEGYDLRVVITSNGTIPTTKTLELLDHENVFFIISTDGFISPNRKIVSRDIEIDPFKVFRMLNDYCKTWGVSMTATDTNLKGVMDDAKVINDEYLPYSIGINYTHLNASINKHAKTKRTEFLKQFFKKLFCLSGYIKNDRTVLEHLDRYLLPLIKGIPRSSDCAAEDMAINVLPDGKTGPCKSLLWNANFYCSINDIGSHIPIVYKRFKQRKIERLGFCKECPARYICGGGCACDSYWINNTINMPDETICKGVLWVIEEFIWSLIEEQTKKQLKDNPDYVLSINKKNIKSLYTPCDKDITLCRSVGHEII